MLECGGQTERLPTRTVIWAAGVAASPLAKSLAEATGAALDRAGRIAVEPDLSLPGHPEIFVLGDMANYTHQGGKPLPGVAPVAIQQGRFVARLIRARLSGKPLPKFRYRDLGNLATIGRSAAVADFGRVRLSGFVAWVLWLFIHLMNIVNYRNRVLVFLQWGWNYLDARPLGTIDHGQRSAAGDGRAQTIAASLRLTGRHFLIDTRLKHRSNRYVNIVHQRSERIA